MWSKFSLDLTPPNCLQLSQLTAGLYKLNLCLSRISAVYSGPSGLFRKHVDTPCPTTQIVSLVVCLPSSFKGGRGIIQHEGREVKFDWSSHGASEIQWVAFHSDSEHNIKTVIGSESITLTYNLYITKQVEPSISSGIIVDPKSLLLYAHLKNILKEPGFMICRQCEGKSLIKHLITYLRPLSASSMI
ncbi:hypothetical protein N7457_001972 [Penicillium paradoxum]|uniref:uncharacterized protein n=1 Tax=Penicillium paradoxum TaxID=176176 RepID=UPI002546CD54|nr:uncharacterized protein N7457_001972 [Penicillium paradoxum]KAJ5786982.1 hypothetical protein N7457_001972 [Penicillium paradoxum]